MTSTSIIATLSVLVPCIVAFDVWRRVYVGFKNLLILRYSISRGEGALGRSALGAQLGYEI